MRLRPIGQKAQATAVLNAPPLIPIMNADGSFRHLASRLLVGDAPLQRALHSLDMHMEALGISDVNSR
jgi:hypothetical protein